MLNLLTASPLQEAVFDRLRSDLLTLTDQDRRASGELIPPENIIAKKYNISRSFVRPALKEMDIIAIFLQDDKNFLARDLFENDLLHLSPKGYDVWGKAVTSRLHEFGAKSETQQ